MGKSHWTRVGGRLRRRVVGLRCRRAIWENVDDGLQVSCERVAVARRPDRLEAEGWAVASVVRGRPVPIGETQQRRGGHETEAVAAFLL